MRIDSNDQHHAVNTSVPRNKGKFIGPKPPPKLKEIWAIRVQLQLADRKRDLALFNLAIDSKLRGCDLVRIRVSDVYHGDRVVSRASVVQRKTDQPAKFELGEQTRESVQQWSVKQWSVQQWSVQQWSVQQWIESGTFDRRSYLFPSRLSGSPHISTRQYARIVKRWISLNPA